MANAIVSLGLEPAGLQVILTKGGDFEAVLTYEVDGVATNWPVGTSIALVFSDPSSSVWSAAVSTTDATFAVDKATTDAMADGTPVKLRYVNGTTDRILMVGKVARRG